VRVGRHVTGQPAGHQPDLPPSLGTYLAASDADRAADLIEAWTDPAVRAVVCARGGYGVTRLLDRIGWAALRGAEPKVLLGASDITALHQAVATCLGLTTLFGPMPATEALGGPDPDLASVHGLRRMLLDAGAPVDIASPGVVPLVGGRARGVLVGGTLTMLAAMTGTRYARPAAGAVVLLEDVNEAAYRIDRLLTQLLSCGWFRDVRGVVLGSWVGCEPEVYDVLRDRLGGLGVPVLGGFAIGHGRPQLTVPLGTEVTLDADAGTLTMAEGALC
jgi:muramoyltetrapeptide carboxypeptidase